MVEVDESYGEVGCWLERQTTGIQVIQEPIGCHTNKQPPFWCTSVGPSNWCCLMNRTVKLHIPNSVSIGIMCSFKSYNKNSECSLSSLTQAHNDLYSFIGLSSVSGPYACLQWSTNPKSSFNAKLQIFSSISSEIATQFFFQISGRQRRLHGTECAVWSTQVYTQQWSCFNLPLIHSSLCCSHDWNAAGWRHDHPPRSDVRCYSNYLSGFVYGCRVKRGSGFRLNIRQTSILISGSFAGLCSER